MQEYTDRVSLRRLNFIIILGLEMVAGAIICCYISDALIDKLMCILAVSISFFLVFVISMTRGRLTDKLNDKVYVSYGKVAIGMGICWLCNIAFLYLPEYFAPMMIIPIILACVLNVELAISCGIYFVVILGLSMGSGIYLIMCYCMMVIIGGMLGEFSFKSDGMTRMFSVLLAYSINVLIALVFYYFAYLELDRIHVIYGLLSSMEVAAFMVIVVPLFSWSKYTKEKEIYMELIEEDYPLVSDIRKFSYIEYRHAQRVSLLSGLCAEEIGANADLARCAGFYYRLGKMEGEPEIDNAIRVANDNCFPKDVIGILAEYGGILKKPSCPESAIINMVDSVVTKIELMDKDTMQSNWNQNMVIYQTINELSQNGMYDESGLSMNNFLLVREKLTREDILA